MVYGALPVLLLSHFSLPPFPVCVRVYVRESRCRYISFKNFLRLSFRFTFSFARREPTEVG